MEQAYTKRTRIKPKKKKNVVNGTGVAQARLGIGDQVRVIMERRKRWKISIGPMVEETPKTIPSDTIFGDLEELEKAEREKEVEDD